MDYFEKLKNISERIDGIQKNNSEFFSNLSFQIEVNGKNGNALAKLPSEKDTKSFLLDFRPFLLQGEEICFPSLCNLISKNSTGNDDLLKKINETKKVWNDFLNGDVVGGLVLKNNKEVFKVKEIIDLWLNGKFFHPTDRKEKKHEKLRNINIPPFGPMHYFAFIDILQRLAMIIFWFNKNVIKELLNNNKKYERER